MTVIFLLCKSHAVYILFLHIIFLRKTHQFYMSLSTLNCFNYKKKERRKDFTQVRTIVSCDASEILNYGLHERNYCSLCFILSQTMEKAGNLRGLLEWRVKAAAARDKRTSSLATCLPRANVRRLFIMRHSPFLSLSPYHRLNILSRVELSEAFSRSSV